MYFRACRSFDFRDSGFLRLMVWPVGLACRVQGLQFRVCQACAQDLRTKFGRVLHVGIVGV